MQLFFFFFALWGLSSMLVSPSSPSAGRVPAPTLVSHLDELSTMKQHLAWGGGKPVCIKPPQALRKPTVNAPNVKFERCSWMFCLTVWSCCTQAVRNTDAWYQINLDFFYCHFNPIKNFEGSCPKQYIFTPLISPSPDVHIVISSIWWPAESSIAICLTIFRNLDRSTTHTVFYLLLSQWWWWWWGGWWWVSEWGVLGGGKKEQPDGGRKRIKQQWLTDGLEGDGGLGNLNIVIHCRSLMGVRRLKLKCLI